MTAARRWNRPPPPPARRARPAAYALLLAAGVALFSWAVLRHQPAPDAAIVLFAEDSALNPAPVAGWFALAAPEPLTLDTVDRLKSRPLGPTRRPLIVVVAAPGVRTPDGPALLTASGLVPVRQLLAALAELPAGRRKLLVFDATTAENYPDHGFAHNGFVAGLESINADIQKVPNLLVVAANQPGERSWVAPEFRATAFGLAFAQGLAGRADADGDRRVTAGELLAHVESATNRWANLNRRATQRPWSSASADLTTVPLALRVRPQLAPDIPQAFAPGDDLAAAWRDHAELAAHPVHPAVYSPVAWARFRRALHAWERFAAQGDAHRVNRLRPELARHRAEIVAARAITTASYSATIAHGLTLEGTAVTDELASIVNLAALAPEARAAAFAALPGGPATDLSRAASLVHWTRVDPAARLAPAAELAPVVCRRLTVTPVEITVLEGTARQLPAIDPATARPRLVAELLDSRRRVESLAAPPFPEVVAPKFTERLTPTSDRLRLAEDRLFSADPADWQAALTECNALQTECDQLGRDQATLEAAHRQSLAAHSDLTGLEPWLAEPADDEAKNATRERRWQTARNAQVIVKRIVTALDANTLTGEQFRQLAADANEQAALKDRLEGDYRAALDASLTTLPDPADLDAMTAWHRHAETLVFAVPPGPDSQKRHELAVNWDRVSRQVAVLARQSPDRAITAVRPNPALALDRAARLGPLLTGRQWAETLDEANTKYAQVIRRADPGLELALADQRLRTAFFTNIDDATGLTADAERVTPVGRDATSPATRRRRGRLTAEFLVQQSLRAEADDWYGGGTPRSRRAVRALLRDSRDLGLDGPRVAALAARLEAEQPFPARLEVVGRAKFTDEPAPVATVAVTATRLGLPSVNAEPFPWRLPGEQRWALPKPTNPTTEVETIPLAATGFFRGRTEPLGVAVKREAVPRRVVSDVPPGDAKITLAVDEKMAEKIGRSSGQVVVVVDATGSMGPRPGEPPGTGRYAQALRQLDELLTELPAGIRLTVGVFGHRTARPGVLEVVQDATVWERDPAAQAALVARMGGYQPWADSPVVLNLAQAARLVTPPLGEVNAVVLVGDAIDTAFAADRRANPDDETVPQGLRKLFDGTGTALAVLTQPLADPDEVAAQKLFQPVAEFKPLGYFGTSAQDLGRLLRRASRPQVAVELAPLADPRRAVRQAATGTPTPARIPPGGYAISGGQPNQVVGVRPGDRLDLTLRETPAGTAWERADRGPLALGFREVGDKVWSVLPTADGPVELVFTHENKAILRTPDPGQVWFTSDDDGPVRLTRTPTGGRVSARTSRGLDLFWGRLAPRSGDVKNNPNGRAGWETHAVEVAPGEFAPRNCYAVRLGFPTGDPRWARLTGTPSAGREVRLFGRLGRSTTLFWWNEPPDGNPAWVVVRQSDVVAEAQRSGLTVTLPGWQLPPRAP